VYLWEFILDKKSLNNRRIILMKKSQELKLRKLIKEEKQRLLTERLNVQSLARKIDNIRIKKAYVNAISTYNKQSTKLEHFETFITTDINDTLRSLYKAQIQIKAYLEQYKESLEDVAHDEILAFESLKNVEGSTAESLIENIKSSLEYIKESVESYLDAFTDLDYSLDSLATEIEDIHEL